MSERLGKYMLSRDIRSSFLAYFQERGHTVVPSSSLVPLGDPTLLFTNAGMVQFKDVFLGLEKRPYTRATTAQKCVRAGGKHNDLDNVGFTGRHHTFFEMLGNFSFGDYFKEDAITYAWDFLTRVLELPKDRLWITVFREDDEAETLWKRIAGIPSTRIIRLGEKDNFWAMGETGPCGPCSEIIIDRGEAARCGPGCGIGTCDCDRWLEIWNLVFMQFMRDERGNMTPLPKPSIDTGMGLERITSVLQGVDTDFDTDLFVPIMEKIQDISGVRPGGNVPVFPFRVIADHIRACVFLASDGVQPSNEGRGYVMRRILRRAVRFGGVLGIREPFLAHLVPVVTSIMKDAYPELSEREEYIQKVLTQDEVRFLNTLEEGQRRVQELIRACLDRGERILSGRDAFILYDTYGFPIDLTKDMARDAGLSVDEQGFEQAMQEQRARSRKNRQGFSEDLLALNELLADVPPTRFSGYENLADQGKVVAIIADNQRVTELETGDEGIVVLDVTPFYATSGGQECDRGIIELPGPHGSGGPVAEVVDVFKTPGGVFLHRVRALKPGLMVGQMVRSSVDPRRRRGMTQHHTATHLLHRALRAVLGDHVLQSGSLVQESRLRFDFSHYGPLTPEEIARVEDMVNGAVMADLPVTIEEMSLDEAKKRGAMALFGEKYGEQVRVVQIADFSSELCGGTHVRRTGEIGQVLILTESAISAGIRRIEAVAGEAALNRYRKLRDLLAGLSNKLAVGEDEIGSKVQSLLDSVAALERNLAAARSRLMDQTAEAISAQAVVVEEAANARIAVSRQDDLDQAELRSLGDRLKHLGCSVAILGSAREGRGFLLVMTSQEAAKAGVDAVKIVQKGASVIGGSGGGKPHLAQAGGRDISKLDEALAACLREARRLLAAAGAGAVGT